MTDGHVDRTKTARWVVNVSQGRPPEAVIGAALVAARADA